MGLWVVVGLIPRCLADVVVISTETNKTVTAIADLPALFGPPLPLSGFKVHDVVVVVIVIFII